MLETLFVTLREGLEAALIVAILVAFLRRSERTDLLSAVWSGLAAALILGLVGVFTIPHLMASLHVTEEAYEGFLYLIGAGLVGTFLFWLYRHRGWASGVQKGAQRALQKKWAWIGYFFLSFLLVFREAAETLLFVTAISFSTDWIGQTLGFLIGGGLAVQFGIAFTRGHHWLPIKRVFQLSLFVLIVLMFLFILTGIHELIEAGYLPGGPREMAWIGPIVNNHELIFTAVLGVLIIGMWRKQLWKVAEVTSTNSEISSRAELRKQRARQRGGTLWRRLFLTTLLITMVLLSSLYIYQRPPGFAPAHPLTSNSETVRIPIQEIPIRHLTFYSVDIGNVSIRLLATRIREDDIRVALDACTLCGPRGYYEKGGQFYCRHCGAPIIPETVGREGGCNPVPLPFHRDGDFIQVNLKDIRDTYLSVSP